MGGRGGGGGGFFFGHVRGLDSMYAFFKGGGDSVLAYL